VLPENVLFTLQTKKQGAVGILRLKTTVQKWVSFQKINNRCSLTLGWRKTFTVFDSRRHVAVAAGPLWEQVSPVLWWKRQHSRKFAAKRRHEWQWIRPELN